MPQPRLARGDMPENRLISGPDSREFLTNPSAKVTPAGICYPTSESKRP